jgi:hypothetical protein
MDQLKWKNKKIMRNPEITIFEHLIRHEVGSKATISLCLNDQLTPMKVLLDVAKKQIGNCFDIWWVDDGPPTIFCLSNGSRTGIAFSTRHLEATAQIRLMYAGGLETIVNSDDYGYRQCLKRLAEQLLIIGNVDLAIKVFIESVSNQRTWALYGTDWRFLEYQPLDEAYMAQWFFGLAHELGHIASVKTSNYLDHTKGGLSDQSVEDLVDFTLSKYQNYPQQAKNIIRMMALSEEKTSLIGAKTLRDECMADLFACSIVLEATGEVMFKNRNKDFEFWRYALEMLAFGHVRHTIDALLSFARMISSENNSERLALMGLAQSVAGTVRMAFIRLYLEKTWRIQFDHTEEGSETGVFVSNALDQLTVRIQEDAKAMDDLLGRSMRYALDSHIHQRPITISEPFKAQIALPLNVMLRDSIHWFCTLASAFNRRSDEITQLRQLSGLEIV